MEWQKAAARSSFGMAIRIYRSEYGPYREITYYRYKDGHTDRKLNNIMEYDIDMERVEGHLDWEPVK
jgi:hypothetical protein